MNRCLRVCLLGWLLVGCQPHVTRIVDGQVVAGRSVSAQAYATYLEARMRETSGDVEGAKCSYDSVLKRDPDATEAMVRLGALSCGTDRAEADKLFDAAGTRDPMSTTLFSARAKCAFDAHRYHEALGYAEKAWALSPTLLETNRQLLMILGALGQQERAERLARGLLALRPGDPRVAAILTEDGVARTASEAAAWSLLADGFLRSNPPALASLTSTRLRPSAQKHLERVLLERLAHALVTDNAADARRLARSLGLSTTQLGQRALQVGNTRMALEHLLMAHKLAPERVDLWVQTLEAAELEGDEAIFQQVLSNVPGPSTTLDDESRSRLGRIIARRVGDDAEMLLNQAEPTRPTPVSQEE